MSELKTAALEAIRAVPDDVSLDELLDEIIYRAKIAEGLKDYREGRTVSLEEVKARFKIES